MKCISCRGDKPILTQGEIDILQPQIAECQVKEMDGIKRVEHIFKFKNFARALEFKK